LSFIECLSFGALVSATDPVSTLGVFADLKVEPVLYSIVYGSSAIDDAVALIMFETFKKYINEEYIPLNVAVTIIVYLIIALLVSLVIGSVLGALAALLVKKTVLKGQPKVILCLVLCFVYISYFTCTVLQVSGIISCMFAAISFRYYLEVGSAVSDADFVAIDLMLSFVSYFVETVVFFCIGMSTITIFYKSNEHFDVRFIFWSIFLATASRIVFVYPLSYITNLINGKITIFGCFKFPSTDLRSKELNLQKAREKGVGGSARYISMNEQHMIVFAGLRGPIAYAAAQLYPSNTGHSHSHLIRFATLIIVLSNIFINGSLTELALKFFGIQYGDDHARSIDDHTHEDDDISIAFSSQRGESNDIIDIESIGVGMVDIEIGVELKTGKNDDRFSRWFNRFEVDYMIPLFEGRRVKD
jgi:NhaP-type Na+/H+ or K+/H+ antiporter